MRLHISRHPDIYIYISIFYTLCAQRISVIHTQVIITRIPLRRVTTSNTYRFVVMNIHERSATTCCLNANSTTHTQIKYKKYPRDFFFVTFQPYFFLSSHLQVQSNEIPFDRFYNRLCFVLIFFLPATVLYTTYIVLLLNGMRKNNGFDRVLIANFLTIFLISLIIIFHRGKALLGHSDVELSSLGGYDLVHFDDLAYVASAHQERKK